MTTVSPKKNHDPARVNEISEKLMENSEIASLISVLSAGSWYRGYGSVVLPVSG
ncbi:hypothetical protein ACOI9P_02565 [Corynebacterium striatum]|uniref:hypothetical protein n=1 Tax=Corynebacterium striatum TaxID=43770 RepID=UPI003B5C67BC